MTKTTHLPIAPEFMPLEMGETKNVALKNGSSIWVKWKKKNTFIIRYTPENRADPFAPFFLFEFKDNNLKRTLPCPNWESILYFLFLFVVFVLIKGISFKIDLIVLGLSTAVLGLIQILVGIIAYNKIRAHVF